MPVKWPPLMVMFWPEPSMVRLLSMVIRDSSVIV
jgi:hypothetical protein